MLQSMPTLVFGKSFDPEATANGFAIAGGAHQTTIMKDYSRQYRDGDLVLEPNAAKLVESIVKRLSRLQRTVGYGNFCLFNFDEMRHIACSYQNIGTFRQIEIDCLENFFYTPANRYGFLGEKIFHNITDRIDKQLAEKISGTGNYLYKGPAIETYRKISSDVGSHLILTAGVRGIVKQFYLFLSKALRHNGNLSLAARSIAPPGYSFHAAGDFDVGKAGYGIANFTGRFTETDVYDSLKSLDYVKFRYPPGNPTGIVFEPWHIQVV
jgi:D-alanyl-D-alanine carboxypeptidase